MRSLICTSVFMLAAASNVALAQPELPAPQVVELVLREIPSDPQSAVYFRIFLDLTPVDRDGDFVGWEIDSIEFRKPRANDVDVVWVHDFPFVPTADGLWWTQHADPLVPAAGEFVLVPWMLGTAESLDAGYDDLEFDLAGDEYTQAPPSTTYAATTGLSYTLRAAAAAEPPVDDANDDEPVEMPLPTNDPNGMAQ